MLELGARLLLQPARYHRAPIELHDRFGFHGVPNFEVTRSDGVGEFVVRLNRSGFRGRELPAEGATPDASRRIVFVGDSFLVAEALRDEQLVTSLVEQALVEEGESVLAYNLSGVDTGTAQQLRMLRDFGPRIRPTEVVLFFYPGNDLINNEISLAGRSRVSAGDYLRPYRLVDENPPRFTYTHPVRAWLRHHSRLYAEVERRLLVLGSDPDAGWLSPWPPLLHLTERLRLGLAPSEDLEMLRSHDPGHRWERAWRSTEQLLAEFQSECEALGARLMVVVVPNVHQVMRTAKGIRLEVVTRALSNQPIDRILDWDLPERRLVELGRARGIEMRPLLGVLRTATSQGGLPYGRDDHLSPLGQEIAAETVMAWLRGEPRRELPDASRGRPVWILPDHEVATFLDFEADPHEVYLGDGWLDWRPKSSASSWGWQAGQRALVVLRPVPAEFTLRGEVPPELDLPIEGYVALMGLPATSFRIEAHGPFDLRLDPMSGSHELFQSRGGSVAIELASDGVKRVGTRLVALRIHAIGFADPSLPPQD